MFLANYGLWQSNDSLDLTRCFENRTRIAAHTEELDLSLCVEQSIGFPPDQNNRDGGVASVGKGKFLSNWNDIPLAKELSFNRN